MLSPIAATAHVRRPLTARCGGRYPGSVRLGAIVLGILLTAGAGVASARSQALEPSRCRDPAGHAFRWRVGAIGGPTAIDPADRAALAAFAQGIEEDVRALAASH